MTVLEFDGVSKIHPSRIRHGSPFYALKHVDLTIDAKERVGIVGASGAGKSTLSRIALGLTPPSTGTIRLFGTDVTRFRANEWKLLRKNAQLLFQNPRSMLHPRMTLGQILIESAQVHRPQCDAYEESQRVLEQIGLGSRRNARVHQLSGGEQRRAGIGRLSLAKPKLVIADEPTSGLDASHKVAFIEFLYGAFDPDCTVIIISHDLPLIHWACERVDVLHQGQIIDDYHTESPNPQHEHTLSLLRCAGLQGGK